MPNLRKMNMVAGRGQAPINFTSLGIGRHSKSVYNVVNRKVFPSKTYPDPAPTIPAPTIPAPTIATALAVNADNTSATITFSKAVYKSDGSSALTASELGLTIASGTSTLTSYTVSTSDNTTFTFALTLAGTSDGAEVLTLAGTVYDSGAKSNTVISTTVTFNNLTLLLMVNQLNTDTNVGMADDMYQSFTATQSCKLKKFAFSTSATFSGSATIIIREGEGITGTNMYSDTWTIDTTASAAIVYDITTDVNLINGQKYSIQLTAPYLDLMENQSSRHDRNYFLEMQ